MLETDVARQIAKDPMIQLIEGKDIEQLWSRINEINERTKRQTLQIKELKDQIKDLKQ